MYQAAAELLSSFSASSACFAACSALPISKCVLPKFRCTSRSAGAIAHRVGIVPDEPRAFLDALQDQLVRADLVVTSGGVSQGDFDVVKEALQPLGSVWFGPVSMQPGKPQGFGVVGEDRIPIFTLPGNPVSSYISFEMFVLPALRKLMGMDEVEAPAATASLLDAAWTA